MIYRLEWSTEQLPRFIFFKMDRYFCEGLAAVPPISIGVLQKARPGDTI